MVSWVIIAVLILLVFMFFKVKTTQHRLYTILLIALLLFFYATGAKVIEDNDVDLGTFEGVVSAGKLYVNWLGQVFVNTKTIIGNAIKMNWAGNSTVK